ncbi:FixH family protein [Thioalkalivibrio paradoxus]|nr:FixH family protein [Thioalkalivibrio paradoxus]
MHRAIGGAYACVRAMPLTPLAEGQTMKTEFDSPTQTPEPTPSAGPSRGVRMLALGVGAGFLLFVGALFVVPFLIPDQTRLNAMAPIAPAPGLERGGHAFAGTVGSWDVRGQITIDAGRQARIAIDVTQAGGVPVPATLPLQLALDMPEHAMQVLRPTAAQAEAGSYLAQSRLPMAGLWRLHVELPEGTGLFDFNVPQ